AQTPPPPPQQQPAANLDQYLARWEQEMQRVQTLIATLERTEKDKAFQSEKKLAGQIKYAKANGNNYFAVEMTEPGNKEFHEKIIYTGPFLYVFNPGQKEIYAHRIGSATDGNPMSMIFNMKAEQLKTRYDLKLTNVDQNYIYIEVAPRTPEDKAEFKRA